MTFLTWLNGQRLKDAGCVGGDQREITLKAGCREEETGV